MTSADVSTSRESGSDAPERLIRAAIELFGRKGFEGTSTRQIARDAGVNISGIAYHFGGKQGLYEACAHHIAGHLRDGIARETGATSGDAPDAPAEAADRLRALLSAMVRILLAAPETDGFARFILREQMDPTPAFDILFTTVMNPVHDHICRLWSAASGEPADSEESRAKMLGLVAQIFLFRMGRAGALRRLGWTAIGPRETAIIERLVHGTLDGLLSTSGGRG